MNVRLTLPIQLFFSLLVGLLFGYLVSPAVHAVKIQQPPVVATSASPVASQQTFTPVGPSITTTTVTTPRPFVTLPGVWQVRVTFNRSSPPVINRVTPQQEGRISTPVNGDGRVEVRGSGGQALYSASFAVRFKIGEPPQDVDTMPLTLILPRMQGETQIYIHTPQGEATYAIEQ